MLLALHLKNVNSLIIINISLNLMSLHVFDKNSYHDSFNDGKWKYTEGKEDWNIYWTSIKLFFNLNECYWGMLISLVTWIRRVLLHVLYLLHFLLKIQITNKCGNEMILVTWPWWENFIVKITWQHTCINKNK